MSEEKKITKNTVFNTLKTDGLKKPFYVESHLYEKVMKHIESKSQKEIETKSRRSTIIPNFVGLKFKIHNGKTYKSVLITENMIGRKLGEFSPTRTFKGHPALKGAKTGDKKK